MIIWTGCTSPMIQSASERSQRLTLLNGAQNWEQYSYGGCAEVYDGDICERLCTESQKKKTRDGELPLMGEDWLTVQARALRQAARIVIRYANRRD